MLAVAPKLPISRFSLIMLALLVAALGWMAWQRSQLPSSEDGAILLLVPDGMTSTSPRARIWLDAASEEGIAMRTVTASQLLHVPTDGDARRLLVVPDNVEREVSGALISRVAQLAAQGRVMLVYDALTASGAQVDSSAPLASQVGVDYARYRELGSSAIRSGSVLLTADTETLLRLPPGKTLAVTNEAARARLGAEPRAVSGYEYGVLTYPSFATSGNYDGATLMVNSDGDLVAGYRASAHGAGGVLFVNLPLGDLKGRTDGLLLHSLLRYFAVGIGHLPTLSAAPGGVGALIFNWHVDSNSATAVLRDIDSYPVMQQGPFSIHVTAGPDMQRAGDHAGLDLDHNPIAQSAITRFVARGDAIGSHGGWIHNYFGERIPDEQSSEFTGLIERNIEAVERASKTRVVEYSAPLGNQPEWVTRWLEGHGFLAYYFTGNTGMSPTRSYREGRLDARKIWSFPIVVFGAIASFDEAREAEISEEVMTQWLRDVTEYVANTGTIKTFYSHPHIFPRYRATLHDWFAVTARLQQQGRFHWLTMTQVAQFLNRRDNVRWTLSRGDSSDVVKAEAPDSVNEFTWLFPRDAFEQPSVDSGQATVTATPQEWRVVGQGGQRLTISAKRIAK
jgi:peptidoglycan/xylan/chitin deacetylase (PgdA/CDA1 family)